VFLSINRQIAWLDARLAHLAQSDETMERLCTAPSVGPVTAAAYSSTVDDPGGFKSAHQVEGYLGLIRLYPLDPVALSEARSRLMACGYETWLDED
jgi:hypothetical protein